MDRLGAVLGSILFLFVAPGIVAGLIPWSISRYEMKPPLLSFEPLRWLGVLLLTLGGVLLLETFARFALQGRGTPAPIAPTKSLVVTGSYHFVRNPMYVAVVSPDPRPGAIIRRRDHPRLGRRGLAHGACVRLELRGADAQHDLWRTIRPLPRQCASLAAAPPPWDDHASDPLPRLPGIAEVDNVLSRLAGVPSLERLHRIGLESGSLAIQMSMTSGFGRR